MKGHFLGQGQERGGASSSHGSSLAVRQFVDLISGWMPVHIPSTPFRVEAVETEERYCLRCCGVHAFDVVRGTPPLASPQMEDRNLERGMIEVAFCRCCGAEFGKDGAG